MNFQLSYIVTKLLLTYWYKVMFVMKWEELLAVAISRLDL